MSGSEGTFDGAFVQAEKQYLSNQIIGGNDWSALYRTL